MKEFMTEFYSPGKTQILRNKIATFAQGLTETIVEAYERFNDYIRAVPHHKFSGRMWSRSSIKASLLHQGGSLTHRPKVADNDAWASSGRLQPLQAVGAAKSVLQVEREEVLEGKIDSLMRRLEKMEWKREKPKLSI